MTASHLPTLTVQVAFANNPFDASPTWTTFSTAKLAQMSTVTGRQQAVNAFQAGTATLTFTDFNRELDPLNSSGAHYGNLKPNKRIRVLASIGAITNQCVFDGYVNQWPTTYSGPVLSQCQVMVSDALKLLQRATLPDCPYAAAVLADSPSGYWRLGETTGVIAQDSSGNGNDGSYQIDKSLMNTPTAIFGSSVGSLSSNMLYPWPQEATIPIAACPTGTTFTLEFWMAANVANVINQWAVYVNGSPGTLQFSYNSGTGAAQFEMLVGGTGFAWAAPNDTLTHHYVFSVAAPAATLYVDGTAAAVTASAGTLGSTPAPTVGGQIGSAAQSTTSLIANGSLSTISDFAVYQGVALTQTQAAAHHLAGTNPRYGETTGPRISYALSLVGWPAGRSSIDTGISTLGAAKWSTRQFALPYLQTVEASEQGEFFFDHVNDTLRFADRTTLLSGTNAMTSQATFTDDPTIHDYSGTVLRYETLPISTDDQLIYNEVSLQWDGGTYLADNGTSQTSYGSQANPVSQTILPALGPVTQLGVWLLSKYSDAQPRVMGMTLDPVTNVQLWAQVLQRAISDRITLRAKPNNTGGAATIAVNIEGINHQIDANAGTWATTFYMRTADQKTATWDVSLWDGSDVRSW